MQAFVPHFDVIGVETSFEQTPKVREFAQPLMRQRRTAVLAGLETYFYQTNETLRWRGYRSVLDGASGIGLCPSGMLQARPDKVNFLRGLNGEFRGLARVIMADEPEQQLTVTSASIDIMERMLEGARYVFAVRCPDNGGSVKVRFLFPRNVRYAGVKVMFEDRTLQPTADGFEDEFAHPKAVHVYRLEAPRSAE
jgi:hypothetical protein